MTKYWWSIIALCAMIACGGSDTITSPVPQQDAANVSTAPAVQPNPQQPQAVVPVTVSGWDGLIKPNAGWYLLNTSNVRSTYTAYWTDFDDQSIIRGSKTFSLEPNSSSEDTFNKTCVQVDVAYASTLTAPFLFGYIKANGQVVSSITVQDRLDCGPKPQPSPTPSPIPTPSPSPTPPPPPCRVVWEQQEPIINYSEWSECKSAVEEACVACSQSRLKKTLIEEKNSCTGELRVKSDTSVFETRPCPCPPEPKPVGICHVSNKGQDGKNNHLEFSWKKKGTPGHEDHVCPKFNPPDFSSTEEDCDADHMKWCSIID